eukprot:Pgem_evm1s569
MYNVDYDYYNYKIPHTWAKTQYKSKSGHSMAFNSIIQFYKDRKNEDQKVLFLKENFDLFTKLLDEDEELNESEVCAYSWQCQSNCCS